jgi:hypothetical protein
LAPIGPEVGQPERGAAILRDVAARRAVGQLDPEAHAARDQRDVSGRDVHHTHLGRDPQPAVLRHDQQLAVGGKEHARRHRAIGGIKMDETPSLPP